MPSDLQDSQFDIVGAEMGDGGKMFESPDHQLEMSDFILPARASKGSKRVIPYVRDISCFMKIALVT